MAIPRWNLARIKQATQNFTHYDIDIRNRDAVLKLVDDIKPHMIIHAAAQPSHDLAASMPFEDFDVNAVGTLNLLEAVRRSCPESVFCFTSTNKVYGDAPNEIPLTELETRWEYAREEDFAGVNESMRIDRCKHSLFGASKVAADIMVQEYGRYFNIPTVCFRGGCLTGPAHSAAELHGFLAYLVKCASIGRAYRVFGYKGKQVRDNIHAHDVCRAFEVFYENPSCGAVYNLGGGRDNSVSILEAIERAGQVTGKKLAFEYEEGNRIGDHICYISDLTQFKTDYPNWSITRSLDDIFDEIAEGVATFGA